MAQIRRSAQAHPPEKRGKKRGDGVLVEGYGVRPALAEAMVKAIAGPRAWRSPRLSELKPGQMVWLAHERFGVILPTAGTVLDMGRTLGRWTRASGLSSGCS